MNKPTILVLGANGATGRYAVDKALEHGASVIAADRHPGDHPPRAGVTDREVDVLDKASVVAALDGVDAVISAIGVDVSLQNPRAMIDPAPIFTTGTETVLAAMDEASVKRIVVISATFVETIRRGPIWFEAAAATALAAVFDELAKMEARLRASDADWTAVRPGWLLDEPFTGDYTISENVIPEDHIRTRMADLGDFLVRCALDGLHVGQTPAISRPESALVSSPLALVEEAV